MRILYFILVLLLTFSCVGQKEVAWVDYDYLLKDQTAFRYSFFNAIDYNTIIKIEGGIINISFQINKEGRIVSIDTLKYRTFPKDQIFSKKEKEKLIELIKEYTCFHNPTGQNANLSYNINLAKLLAIEK